MIAFTADRKLTKMRTTFALYLILALSASLSLLSLPASSQIYSFSASPTGQYQLAAMDYAFQDDGGTVGVSDWIDQATLSETLYYDPTAQTLQQVGSISFNGPTNVTLSFNERVHINSTPETATVTVDFSLPSVLAFDTGVQASTGANNEFISSTLAIPIVGTYSILTGNQTLSGSFDYSLYFPSILTDISDVTPTSLIISQPQVLESFAAPDIASGVSAADGMVFNLVGGISDGTYESSWLLNPLMVTAVPEPGTRLLFSFALLALGVYRSWVTKFGNLRLRRLLISWRSRNGQINFEKLSLPGLSRRSSKSKTAGLQSLYK